MRGKDNEMRHMSTKIKKLQVDLPANYHLKFDQTKNTKGTRSNKSLSKRKQKKKKRKSQEPKLPHPATTRLLLLSSPLLPRVRRIPPRFPPRSGRSPRARIRDLIGPSCRGSISENFFFVFSFARLLLVLNLGARFFNFFTRFGGIRSLSKKIVEICREFDLVGPMIWLYFSSECLDISCPRWCFGLMWV